MKKLKLLFLLSILSVGFVFAQADKKTIKEWEYKKKEMDPLQFKKLTEEHTQAENEKKALQTQISNLEAKLKVKEELTSYLTNELDSLKKMQSGGHSQAVTHDLSAKNKTNHAPANNDEGKWGKGIVFKVQIGAFKNKDLTKYLDNNKNFSGDVDADGQRKYTLGYFRDYWEADNFKKMLREMGVSDAWVVAYKDGQRVSIKDVLEGAIE